MLSGLGLADRRGSMVKVVIDFREDLLAGIDGSAKDLGLSRQDWMRKAFLLMLTAAKIEQREGARLLIEEDGRQREITLVTAE
jgi:hypothetical protein